MLTPVTVKQQGQFCHGKCLVGARESGNFGVNQDFLDLQIRTNYPRENWKNTSKDLGCDEVSAVVFGNSVWPSGV